MENLIIYLGIFVFLVLTILIGFLTSRKESLEDFLIASRNLKTFESVMTLSGTFVGAMTLLVYTSFVFLYGISALWIFVGYLTGFILFSYFAVSIKKFSKGKKFYTMFDYFNFRFNKKVASLITFIVFLFYFGGLSAQFIGSGKILSQISSIPYNLCVFIIFFVIAFYLINAGFKSVVKTDVFQFSLLFLILVLMVFLIKNPVVIPLELLNPFSAGVINILAFFLLGVLTPFIFQDYWQKIFAIKDFKIVKKSFILSGFLVFTVSGFLTYIGLIAKVNFTNIDSDLAILQSFTQFVPGSFIFFVVILFLASILSTSDTYLFVLAMNFVNDFYPNKLPVKRKVFLVRISIFFIGFLALLVALVYPKITEFSIIFKSFALLITPIIISCWFFKPKSKTIISTILTSSFIFFILIFNNYIKPELAFVSVFLSFFVYFFYYILFKIVDRNKKKMNKNL